MKILHPIYDDMDNPWLGGGATVRTYRRLAKRHDITVAAGNYPWAKPEEERDGIIYKRIGPGKNYLLSRLTLIMGTPGIVKSDHDILVEDFSAPFPYFSPVYTKRPVIAGVGGTKELRKLDELTRNLSNIDIVGKISGEK